MVVNLVGDVSSDLVSEFVVSLLEGDELFSESDGDLLGLGVSLELLGSLLDVLNPVLDDVDLVVILLEFILALLDGLDDLQFVVLGNRVLAHEGQ